MTDFIENQLRCFRSLQSTQIDSWTGLEYAIWVEGPDGDPVFRRADVPCLQFAWLVIQSAGRPAADFRNSPGSINKIPQLTAR